MMRWISLLIVFLVTFVLVYLTERNEKTNDHRDIPRVIAAGAASSGSSVSAWRRASQAVVSVAFESSEIDFGRDIRPILAEHCLSCHGPDAGSRKENLRLDIRDEAIADRGGYHAVSPGHPDASEMIARITSDDESTRMPPSETGKQLTERQVKLLRQWIADGAEYSAHWSFTNPSRPNVPVAGSKHAAWPRNPIDNFVLARLSKDGLVPSPEADRITLIRRLYHDLTGLPPTPSEVDAFQNDDSPDAYEQVVERLLASPHYGERMALEWLDVARYADSHGYSLDCAREMTLWRDWVINAFNENKPFDQFTIEQIAGDLLPDPSVDQRIATGFYRNHMMNNEGGSIPEEFRAEYVMDRVNTTGTAFLGMTVGCARCHDHKYDPISQKEYYQLYAFFNNLDEQGIIHMDKQEITGPTKFDLNTAPVAWFPTYEQQIKTDRLRRQIATLEAKEASLPEEKKSADIKTQLKSLHLDLKQVEFGIPQTMVMVEMPTPRDTHVLIRGQYDLIGEKVLPGTPSFLSPLPEGAQVNRLGLAQWLVSPDHPLTARVTVNRYWQMYFGTGLVKTSEDFGTQGEWPSHLDLLDWLACEFREPTCEVKGRTMSTPWDVKHIQRLIVLSATYRQSAKASPDMAERDPENRLLARMSRVRLPAEFIRDQALMVSGLLNVSIGGKSVFPYQPAGLWEELSMRPDSSSFSGQFYVQSHGQDLYRRTMYTFWKRSCPLPGATAFDAPSREACTVRRQRTNTPLQALVLLNDTTYIEASRKLAERILAEAGPTSDEKIIYAFRLCLSRHPADRELETLRGLFDSQLARYQKNMNACLQLLSVGESPRNEQFDTAELAAWTMVAGAVLNLDETITRN